MLKQSTMCALTYSPSPPSWRAMANNTGATCLRCGKGRYKVFDLNDDIFGDLRCDICRHHVKLNQDLMAEPTPLSPAAQAVLIAAEKQTDLDFRYAPQIAAAALRAAANQVVPVPIKAQTSEEHWALLGAKNRLLAIADELEGFNG